MASETEDSSAVRTASLRDLTLSGAAALISSVLVNCLLVFGTNTGGIAPELEALNYGPVTLFTALGVVGATVTYGILTRTVSNPNRTFVLVAAVVLLVSLVPDFTVIPVEPGGSLVAGAILGAMHVTTAIICVGVLTRFNTRLR
ncbi:DUF6069 family protein [Natrinema versiforme]|uniref:Uncharacterized protein n=1 Tax=Natrinema versiforme TaxID=88724 RepID=A0A4V1FXU4_9EURY|nr:DUF6069 family protein [Natrinema versiforme]QCS41095.1 hypothetical protein FEJ81_01560 [Natrinema versiforme]